MQATARSMRGANIPESLRNQEAKSIDSQGDLLCSVEDAIERGKSSATKIHRLMGDPAYGQIPLRYLEELDDAASGEQE